MELVVFDFDETIINCNSDTHIKRMTPNGKFPAELWKDEYDLNWTNYMQQVFIYLHQIGCNQEDYRKCLETIEFVPGMKDLLKNLSVGTNEKQFEVIIISDANSFFINHILEFNNLLHCFKKIFTNTGEFDEKGCLRITGYHQQDWCTLSAENLCKGHVLREYIDERAKLNQIEFSRISYVGDGSNDLCPSLKLSNKDLVFPRYDFRLHRLALEKIKSSEMKAEVVPFQSGADIWNRILAK